MILDTPPFTLLTLMALGGVFMRPVTELGSNGRKALMTARQAPPKLPGSASSAYYRVRPLATGD